MSLLLQILERVLDDREQALPPEVILQAKRVVLDSVACMYGAIGSETHEAVDTAVHQDGQPGSCTLLGQLAGAQVRSAMVFNGALLRYLDLNDVQESSRAPGPRHGHNSELLPAILAVAERFDLTGSDVLSALSLGYDVAVGFTEGVIGPSLEERGWNMDLRAAFAVPIALGTMLGLDRLQIGHAVGIALSRAGLLNILDSDTEVNSIAKNLRFPLTAQMAFDAVMLARAGVTGPLNVFEGQSGFISTLLGGDFDSAPLLAEYTQHRILDTIIKSFASCYATHGHLTATTALVTSHDVHPEDVSSITVRTTTRGVRHTAQPSRRNPTNKETADHSSFYLTAVAVYDRRVGAEQFTREKLYDPDIRDLADRVQVEVDPSLDAHYPAATVEMRMRDGAVLSHTAMYPQGHPQNPISDVQIADKFRGLVIPRIGEASAAELEQAVQDLGDLASRHRLSELLRQPARA